MPVPEKQLTCAVIGTGVMGKSHLRTYAQLSGVRLVAVSDLNQAEGKKIAEEYKIAYYADVKELLTKERPDVVSICVPTSAHYAVAKLCLENKVHVLLEKPITDSVATAKKLIALAKKMKVTLLVGHIERHNPAVKEVKKMIDRGDLGEITSLIFRRVGGFPPRIKDANIIVDLAIHDIDIANYLLGSTPHKVVIHKKRNHIKNREDSVELFMLHPRASVLVQANWVTPIKIRKINITGTKGYLELDYITQKIEFFKSNYERFDEQAGTYKDFVLVFSEPDRLEISVAKKEPLKEELSYFLECVRKRAKVDTSFALDALKIAVMK